MLWLIPAETQSRGSAHGRHDSSSSSPRARSPCASPSAAPARSCWSTVHQLVPGASLARPTVVAVARATVSSRWKCVKVWRTQPVEDLPVAPAPAPRLSAWPPSKLALAPRARRHLVHAAQQPLGRPLAQQHGAVLARQHEGEPAPRRLVGLGRAPRQLLGDAELARRGSPSCSGQITQRGLRGVQTVAPRSIIAWA